MFLALAAIAAIATTAELIEAKVVEYHDHNGRLICDTAYYVETTIQRTLDEIDAVFPLDIWDTLNDYAEAALLDGTGL